MAELIGFEHTHTHTHTYRHRFRPSSSNIEHKLSNFVDMNYRASI